MRSTAVLISITAPIAAAIALRPRRRIDSSRAAFTPTLVPSPPADRAPTFESGRYAASAGDASATIAAASFTLPPLLLPEPAPSPSPSRPLAARAQEPFASLPLLLGIATALWFAAAYLWQHRLGGQVWPSFGGTYAAGPYLWTICAAVAYCAWKSAPAGAHETNILPLAAIVGAFSVAVLLIAGMIAGLGHSPYSRSPFWLLTNSFYVGAPLVAFEFTRAYVIRMLKGRATLAVALTALAATVMGFSYRQLLYWDGGQPELIFFSSQFLPDLSANLLASFLVYLGGPFAGITYRAAGALFEWYSPILPDLPWLTASFVGVATPAVGLWVLEGLSGQSEEEMRQRGLRVRAPSTAWMLTATASLAILWFTFGFFGVKPSFIPSRSMEPTIDSGSIVVTKSSNPEDVQVGDIVLYQRGRTHVLHRVIEKRADGSFIFKGDNNNTPDPVPVLAAQIEGKLIVDVPYIGWVPIWASRGIQRLTGQ